MVGTGAVIAPARHIPVAMMLTQEIDIYAEEATNTELILLHTELPVKAPAPG
jgi:hypothetical protein